MNADFKAGYEQAIAVFEAANHPGYCRNAEQAIRVAQSMWQAGLSGAQAKAQRSDFIASDNQGHQAPIPGKPSGNGNIVRPSAQVGADEPDSAVWERWQKEMGGADGSIQPAGEVLPVEIK